MKVLQILPSLDVGGVERGVLDLVRSMKRRGESSVVISAGGALVKELQKMGVVHYELPVNRKSIQSLFLIPKIEEIIRRENIEVVHARSRVPAWIAYFAAKRTGVPFVTTCHGYYSNHILSWVMGWGKRVIVISRVIGRHMVDDFKVDAERIRLIHRGVDLSQFDTETTASRIYPSYTKEGKPFRIVVIGRLSPIKGQLEFLPSVREIVRHFPNIEVHFVGAEGKGKTKYTEQIRTTITQLGIESHVKLLGTRRDIPEILKEADLLVLPTLVPEAFGRVIVEAGALGTPVIATALGGVLDIMEDKVHGRLVTPGHTEGMTEAVLDVLRHPDQARQRAQALHQKVKDQFNLERMVDQTLDVYQEVKQQKKILIFKMGAMGDVILVTPSLRMLRERFPKAHITMMVDHRYASILSDCPYLNEMIPVDRKRMHHLGYLMKLAKQVRKQVYDISIDFQNSKWSHLLGFFGGIEKRYGFRRGAFGFLLNYGDFGHKTVESPVKQQYRLLSKLGVRDFDDALELWTDPALAERWRREINASEGSHQPKVGLVIGASPKWPTKRWPIEYFKQLADFSIQKLNARIVLLGGREDRSISEAAFGIQPPNIINLTGKTSTKDLVAVMQQLDVVVTGDTAPLHIASALGKRIIALFGPTDAKRHMPPSAHANVVHRSLTCQPCYSGVCQNAEPLACLRQISTEEIFEYLKRHIQASAMTQPVAAESQSSSS